MKKYKGNMYNELYRTYSELNKYKFSVLQSKIKYKEHSQTQYILPIYGNSDLERLYCEIHAKI